MFSLSFSETLSLVTTIISVGGALYAIYKSIQSEAKLEAKNEARFKRIEDDFVAMEKDMEKANEARDNLSIKVERVDQRVQGIEKSVVGIDTKIDVKFDSIEKNVDELKKLMNEHLVDVRNR